MDNNTINYVNFSGVLTSGSTALEGQLDKIIVVRPSTVTPSALRLQPASAAAMYATVARKQKNDVKSIVFSQQPNIEFSEPKKERKLEKPDVNIISDDKLRSVFYGAASQKLIVAPEKKENIKNKGKSIIIPTVKVTQLNVPAANVKEFPTPETRVDVKSSVEVETVTYPDIQQIPEAKKDIPTDDMKIELPTDANTTALVESVNETVNNIKKDRELYIGMSDKNNELNNKIATLTADTDIHRQKHEENLATMETFFEAIKNVRFGLNKLAEAAKLKAEEERRKEELLMPAVSKAEEENKIAKLTAEESTEKRNNLAKQTEDITQKAQEIASALGISITNQENFQNGENNVQGTKRK